VAPLQVCLSAQTPWVQPLLNLNLNLLSPAAVGQLLHALLLLLVLDSMLLSCVDLVSGQSSGPAAAAGGAGVAAAGVGVAAAVHLDVHLVWRPAMAVLARQLYCPLETSSKQSLYQHTGLGNATCAVYRTCLTWHFQEAELVYGGPAADKLLAACSLLWMLLLNNLRVLLVESLLLKLLYNVAETAGATAAAAPALEPVLQSPL